MPLNPELNWEAVIQTMEREFPREFRICVLAVQNAQLTHAVQQLQGDAAVAEAEQMVDEVEEVPDG